MTDLDPETATTRATSSGLPAGQVAQKWLRSEVVMTRACYWSNHEGCPAPAECTCLCHLIGET